MRIVVFEDGGEAGLEPLTLTRPSFDLWCGTGTLLDHLLRIFPAPSVALVVRPELAAWCRERHPGVRVNDLDAGDAHAELWLNGRWLPPPERRLSDRPEVGLVGDEVAYVYLGGNGRGPRNPGEVGAALDGWRKRPCGRQVGGRLLASPWELLQASSEVVEQESGRWRVRWGCVGTRSGLGIVGPPDRLVVAPGARLEHLVLFDTTRGPVLIDRDALVEAFSRLEGPCYVGPGTRVRGAAVRASSLGPHCRVGGEVEASVLQGYANKAHGGYLGHSWLGEWVNLGAGTQAADLRVDYRDVVAPVPDQARSGRLKAGSLLGDHTRIGVGALLAPGTTVGPFGLLLPSGRLLPRELPPFCRVRHGQLESRTDLRALFTTAATAMARRSQNWTATQEEFFLELYERTLPAREAAVASASEPQQANRRPPIPRIWSAPPG